MGQNRCQRTGAPRPLSAEAACGDERPRLRTPLLMTVLTILCCLGHVEQTPREKQTSYVRLASVDTAHRSQTSGTAATQAHSAIDAPMGSRRRVCTNIVLCLCLS